MSCARCKLQCHMQSHQNPNSEVHHDRNPTMPGNPAMDPKALAALKTWQASAASPAGKNPKYAGNRSTQICRARAAEPEPTMPIQRVRPHDLPPLGQELYLILTGTPRVVHVGGCNKGTPADRTRVVGRAGGGYPFRLKSPPRHLRSAPLVRWRPHYARGAAWRGGGVYMFV